jgi:hypothetical protein
MKKGAIFLILFLVLSTQMSMADNREYLATKVNIGSGEGYVKQAYSQLDWGTASRWDLAQFFAVQDGAEHCTIRGSTSVCVKGYGRGFNRTFDVYIKKEIQEVEDD